MFSQTTNTASITEITAEQAQDIYNIYKTLKIDIDNVSEAFQRQHELGKDYPFVYFEEVMNETLALKEVAHSAMMKEESPSSAFELQWELASDKIDIATFVSDYIDYTLMYKENTTWEEFVEQFTFLKEQDVI